MSDWKGSVRWGWRDTGEIPIDFPELKQEFDLADTSEVQTHFAALVKTLDQQTNAIASFGSRESDGFKSAFPQYSEATKAACGAFGFISKILDWMNNPRSEWVYLVFLNRMPQTHFSIPHHPPRTEPVASVVDGLTKFGSLVSSSVIDMFSKCDWVMLKLAKGPT